MSRRPRRTFTPEFKAKVVLDVLTGTASQAEVCRKHQISPSLLALWKTTFLQRLPVLFQADEAHSALAALRGFMQRDQSAQAATIEKGRVRQIDLNVAMALAQIGSDPIAKRV